MPNIATRALSATTGTHSLVHFGFHEDSFRSPKHAFKTGPQNYTSDEKVMASISCAHGKWRKREGLGISND